MPEIAERFRRAWNAFANRSPTEQRNDSYGGYYFRPDRARTNYRSSSSIVTAITNQISIDCSNIDIRHVQNDENGRFKEEVNSGLNNCLTLSANMDQTGRALIQDAVQTMLDEGVVAIVPIDANVNPNNSEAIDIGSLRVGIVKQWYPTSIKVEAYDERTGKRSEIIVPKSSTAIIQNPLYSVMNMPNSSMQRLNRKLSLLDRSDEDAYAKMDVIIQFPYDMRSDTTKKQAENRRKDFEAQLYGSRYGIAYAGISDKIIQLNRSPNNQLVDQVEKLKKEIYSQLRLTQSVFDGTADEQTTLNYYNGTVEPILSAIVEEMTRKFLSKNARTRGQAVTYFRNPFKLVPINSMADIADKFTRNAILSSNELRGLIGFKPVDDPDADALRNKNLNISDEEASKLGTGDMKVDASLPTEKKQSAPTTASAWINKQLNRKSK